MSDSCFKKNELLIPGTRQDERLQQALDPSYVLPDERSVADLLVFISSYASLINYYAVKGADQAAYAVDGDWKPLIMTDEAFNYAEISVTPYSLPNVTFYKYVNLYETGSTTLKRNQAYRVLWDILFSVYNDIYSFYAVLPVYMQLRSVIQTEISNNLVADFAAAAGAYLNDNNAAAIPSFNLQVTTSSADDDYKFAFADTIIKQGLDSVWIDHTVAPLANDWTQYLAVLKPNAVLAQQFFNPSLSFVNEQDRIDYSTLRLKQIFKRAFESYARIIGLANEYLQNSLQNNSSHVAHHGLLLTFVKLFGIIQVDANEFTRKHLEYYYSRVLQIKPAAAVPDAAHIVFEPAKNITSHLVEKNTVLNAGKDGTGKQLIYNTNSELVISQVKADQLKTIFLKPGAAAGDVSKVYASAVANSDDGAGAPFTGTDTSWKGFGDVRTDATGTETNAANLGFYISSPVLHLTEGTRQIEFDFTTDTTGIAKADLLTTADLIQLFAISISGEKKWESLTVSQVGVTDFNSQLAYQSPSPSGSSMFKITLTLLPQCKALVGYDPLVCDGNLNTIYPTIRFSLNQNGSVLNAYKKFSGIAISKISIKVTASDLSGLSLENDFGALDPSKPVQLFGPNPKKNNTFYIGHTELEHKIISTFSITMQWLDLNPHLETYYSYVYTRVNAGATSYVTAPYVTGVAGNSSFKVMAGFIRNKSWIPAATPEHSVFTETPVALSFTDAIKPALDKPTKYGNAKIALSTNTQNGFIRLAVSAPDDAFGHAVWPNLFAKQTVAITHDADITHNTVPNPPYTPTLQSVKLQYVASQDIFLDATNYKAEQGQFFHLVPFGINEIHKNAKLFSSFDLQKKESDGTFDYKPLESALYIGISNAVINQTVSMLMQVNEGTEDISVDSPAVTWNYLSKSGWKNLDKSLLADATENLLKSGIVSFSVPVDVNTAGTELPSGLTWVMAAIEPAAPQVASNGLPKLLAVYTNAVKATFTDNGNDPEHLAKALAANTISKLYESDAAVKKVSQPYATFDGKKIEAGKQFYTRVSERLRHKHRSITIWDYERLVLNEFPEIYMVKCLNHTGYETDCTKPVGDPGRTKYKEKIAGQVMLVPVPFITNLQSGNIFQPSLSASKLTDIKNFIHGDDNSGKCNKYIKAIHSQLAKLIVENPTYETIKVTCKIKVRECLDQLYYKQQLGYDLHKFLAPWITGDEGKINFGGRLHASQVVYFIEQLPYIDYLENLTIEHRDKNGVVLNTAEPALAVATTSRSVLTSAGNDANGNPKHQINLS